MIVKMSKVEIAGPRDLLQNVLSMLQDMELLQIEPDTVGFIEEKEELYVESYLPDREFLSERLFLEDVRTRLDELFSYLSYSSSRDSYIQPRLIIDTINETLRGHLDECRSAYERREALREELSQLKRSADFLDVIEGLLGNIKHAEGIDYIGLTLKDTGKVAPLKEYLAEATSNRFDLLTSETPDGNIAGLIALRSRDSERIKKALSDKNIPELSFPPSFSGMDFIDKVGFLRKRINELTDEIEAVNMQLDVFAGKWGAIYRKVRRWVNERLSVLKAAALAFESRMCFFIYGWMAAGDVGRLREALNSAFSGKVVLQELEVREDDIERTPIILKNPAYFKPFELFTRILPIPKYSSYDPTPFIGVFFPLFFGLILGDAGYGIILMVLSFFILKKYREKNTVADACRILFVAAAYSFVFGILYGEFFGELGHGLFGLRPLLVDRRTAIMPMLYFAVTVGVVHVILGCFLGLISALKQHAGKEAVSKLLHILFVICILLLVVSLFGVFPGLLARPIILAILFLTPLLLFTGGLLAPLELIKSIGNIISYARIMAIGLTSVLLAYVANRLGGMTGDVVLGVVVAGLLHLLNIIIGVFSPTIHTLRLHYVEFFSKFIESGGRKFEPLKKEDINNK